MLGLLVGLLHVGGVVKLLVRNWSLRGGVACPQKVNQKPDNDNCRRCTNSQDRLLRDLCFQRILSFLRLLSLDVSQILQSFSQPLTLFERGGAGGRLGDTLFSQILISVKS